MCLLHTFRFLCSFAIQWSFVITTPQPFRDNVPDIIVLENVTVGTIVVSDIHAYLRVPRGTTVRLGPGSLNLFFRLNNGTGQLICINNVDLESPALCRADKSCCRAEQESTESSHGMLGTRLLESSVSNPSEASHHLAERGSTCRLMAFVLSTSVIGGQLSPLTKLHVSVVDLNDQPPVFSLSKSNREDLRGISAFNLPSVNVAFLEGTGGLNSRQDLPLAYDADFSVANRVKRYWLEWSQQENTDAPTTIRKVPKQALMVGENDGPTWATLGPFRLTYLEASRTLSLELESELDREHVQKYHMRMVAEDGGGLQGELYIFVEVLDVNEFDPIFVHQPTDPGVLSQAETQEIYHKSYTVEESLPVGSEVARLYAIDRDHSAENGITYHFGSSTSQAEITETFQLDPQTGSITLIHSLDYEKTRNYRLLVIAQDGSTSHSDQRLAQAPGPSNRRSSTGIVEISVLDVNDNPPVIRFEKDEKRPSRVNQDRRDSSVVHEVALVEDTPKGSPFIYFSVTDQDPDEGGRVTCNLKNWTDHFRLREFSGLFGLETSTAFDREKVDYYQLTIKCHDHGIPELHSSRELRIRIEDVNDSPPTFHSLVYQFQVLENSPSGTLITPINGNYPAAISAFDPDLNSTLTYELLPRRSRTGRPALNTTDSQDFISVDNMFFKIDPVSGYITTYGDLDREVHDHLSFLACANDGKHSACTEVAVLLVDVNDNAPQFERDTYVISVVENHMSNKPLIVFHATDADADNRGFVFEILPEERISASTRDRQDSLSLNSTALPISQLHFKPGTVQYHFAIRENMLYLRRPLDRELRASYQFFVRVTDLHHNGKVMELSPNGVFVNLSSKAEIFVDVEDVNDHMPVLIFPNSTGPAGNRLSVSCHETTGSSIGRLQAFDMDFGLNASVVYSIVHTPEVDQLFHLDKSAGELFVNTGQLQDKCDQNIIMIVSVDDQGPVESKKSRKIPVERLFINLENKPTLAELVAAETPQKPLFQLNEAAGGLVHSRMDMFGSSFPHDAVSTRTVLSVVLGGSTLFLICLLAVWMLLLLYGRAKSRRRLTRLRVLKTDQHGEAELVLPVVPSASPGHLTLAGLRYEHNNEKIGSLVRSEQFRKTGESTGRVGITSDIATLQRRDLLLESTYPRRVTCEKQCSQHKNSNCKVLSMGARTNPILVPRPRSTASLPSDRCLESKLAPWTLDNGIDQEILHFSECSTVCGAHPTNIQQTKNPAGKGSQEAKSIPSLGRLLPNWIANNLVPRRSLKPCAPYNKTECKGSLPESYDLSSTENYSPKKVMWPDAEMHRQGIGSSSGTKLSDSFGHPLYATIRRMDTKPPRNVCATLNNRIVSSNPRTTSVPFLTPPTHKRLPMNRLSTVSQIQPPKVNGEYTSLIRPVCCITPGRAYPKSDVRQSDTKECSFIRRQNSDADVEGVYVLTDSVLPHVHSGEIFYPYRCMSVEPLDSTWLHCELASPGKSTSESSKVCPHCELLEVSGNRWSCSHDTFGKPIRITTTTDSGCGVGVQAIGTQCTLHDTSVQGILNSCV